MLLSVEVKLLITLKYEKLIKKSHGRKAYDKKRWNLFYNF